MIVMQMPLAATPLDLIHVHVMLVIPAMVLLVQVLFNSVFANERVVQSDL